MFVNNIGLIPMVSMDTTDTNKRKESHKVVDGFTFGHDDCN